MACGAVGDFMPRSGPVWRSRVGPRRERGRDVPVAAAVSLLGVPKKEISLSCMVKTASIFGGDGFWVWVLPLGIDPRVVSLRYRGL